MKLYRLCFIAILLHGSSSHAWENQRPAHNVHNLKKALTSTNSKVKSTAKSLLDSNQRVVKGLASLLTSSNNDLQAAGIDLAHIATTRGIDPSTTHAILSLTDLLQDPKVQEKKSLLLKKAQKLIDDLKNTTQPEENCAIAQEALMLHKK